MAGSSKTSERRCIVTREVGDRRDLLRFVLDPEGHVLVDLDERLPGRGIWLSADRDVENRAVARNLFAKAAGARVKVDPDLTEQIERLLGRRALDSLGLARRAGQLTTGLDRIRAWLRSASAAVLVTAADSAADGRRKLRRLAPHAPLVLAFSRTELGAALGREEVVHVALAPGALARRLLRETERLAGFRSDVTIEPGTSVPFHPMEPKETTGTR
jgi:predicted RNA-binding protein YlxR (DUF448 family)